MKSDAEISREIALEHPCDGRGPLSIALVRAGREAVLKQVVERVSCPTRKKTGDKCPLLYGEHQQFWCIRCWATAQLEEIKDAA